MTWHDWFVQDPNSQEYLQFVASVPESVWLEFTGKHDVFMAGTGDSLQFHLNLREHTFPMIIRAKETCRIFALKEIFRQHYPSTTAKQKLLLPLQRT